jgi:hypothetical protein
LGRIIESSLPKATLNPGLMDVSLTARQSHMEGEDALHLPGIVQKKTINLALTFFNMQKLRTGFN